MRDPNEWSWTTSLQAAQRKGRLTVGDLRWYFQSRYWTVRQWVVNDRTPNGVKAAPLFKRLDALHELIRLGWLPVPASLNKPARAKYMRLLGGDDFGRAQLLANDPAGSGLVRRVCPARRGKKTGVVRQSGKAAGVAAAKRRRRV